MGETHEIERKPIEKMTLAECRDEIRDRDRAAGREPSVVSGKVDELRDRVAALRADEEAEPVEGEVVDETDETAEVPAEIEDEVGAAIALREKAVDPTTALPTPAEFNAAMAVAERVCRTTFVPESYRGRPDDVVAAILYGREIGLGPMTAMRDIHMIDGRPALAAHRQLALLRKGGVVFLESEATMERGFIRAQRKDTGEVMSVEFSYEEAEKIRRKGKALVDGDNWRNYRKDMLWARTVGRLTRRLGPDLIGGLPPYVAEEVADFEGWGVEYNATGELGVQQARRSVPEFRKEYPDYNWPASWAELMERLGGKLASAEDATEWVKQAVELTYNADSLLALGQAERAQMFQKCSGALARLDDPEIGGDLAFDPDVRKTVARAFAPSLGGQALEGPPWRISPAESDRPTRDEWQEEHLVAAGTSREPTSEEQADIDRIADESLTGPSDADRPDPRDDEGPYG